MQWSWGLDPHHDTVTGIPPEKSSPTNIRIGRDQLGAEPDIIQATLNLFADMGVTPAAQSGVGLPMRSEDVTAPVITSIDLNEDLISLQVEDEGGVVAAVEFSLDGETWHPADYEDETSWRIRVRRTRVAESLGYNFSSGKNTVRVRPVDDSCNVGEMKTLTVDLK